MGRLEDIVDRNRNPRRHRPRVGLGVGLATVVLFVVLVLLIFTNLANPPESDATDAAQSPAGDGRVRDVEFGTPRSTAKRKLPAGSAAPEQPARQQP